MSKGTPHRPIRISDELWAKAQAKAAQEGTTASAKTRGLLEAWVGEPDNPPTLADAWDEGNSYDDEFPVNPYR